LLNIPGIINVKTVVNINASPQAILSSLSALPTRTLHQDNFHTLQHEEKRESKREGILPSMTFPSILAANALLLKCARWN
jgi:hypothetical protein